MRRRVLLGTGAAALAAGGAGLAAFGGRGTQVEANLVRVGYLPIYTDLPLFVASEMGLTARRGLHLDLVRFESSPHLGTALASRRIDAATAIALSVALSVESSDPGRLQILFVDAPDVENYFSSIITRSDGVIRTVADLRSRAIGIFPGPTAALYFGLVAQKFGLDIRRDANLVELAAATQVPALAGQQVDALMTYEPIATEAVEGYEMRRLLPAAIESQVINPWQSGVGVISTEFLSRNPRTGKLFAEAMDEAIDLIRARPEETRALLHRFTGVPPAIAARVPPMPFTKARESDLEKLQYNAELMRRAGLLSRDVDVTLLMYAG